MSRLKVDNAKNGHRIRACSPACGRAEVDDGVT